MPRQRKAKIILGVTGTIGSGKSTVARMFKAKDCLLVYADRLAHGSFKPGSPVYKKVVAYFGEGILRRGRIDRGKLARVVFVNKPALVKLNTIVHKAVIADIRRRIKESKKKLIILDAALIIESGLRKMVDKLVVVKAGRQQQIARSRRRLGISRDEALQRMKYQVSQGVKLRLADFIIDNSGLISETRKQVSGIKKALAR